MQSPFLGLYIHRFKKLRWKLKHRCSLTLQQVSQECNLPIRKFQRIMMGVWVVLTVDLPKDGCRVIDYTRFPTEQAAWPTTYCIGKCKFRSPGEHKLPCSHLPAQQSRECRSKNREF